MGQESRKSQPIEVDRQPLSGGADWNAGGSRSWPLRLLTEGRHPREGVPTPERRPDWKPEIPDRSANDVTVDANRADRSIKFPAEDRKVEKQRSPSLWASTGRNQPLCRGATAVTIGRALQQRDGDARGDRSGVATVAGPAGGEPTARELRLSRVRVLTYLLRGGRDPTWAAAPQCRQVAAGGAAAV